MLAVRPSFSHLEPLLLGLQPDVQLRRQSPNIRIQHQVLLMTGNLTNLEAVLKKRLPAQILIGYKSRELSAGAK